MAETPDLYIEYLRRAGFGSVRGEVRVKPIHMRTLEPILKGGWAVAGLDQQPQEIQDEIKRNVIENASPYLHYDGTYEFPDKVVVVAATTQLS